MFFDYMLDIWFIRKKVKEAEAKLPAHVSGAIKHGITYGNCATFSSYLKDALQESEDPLQTAKTATSNNEDSNLHTYLVIPADKPEDDIIIDATANQFLKGLEGIFVWTRRLLREILSGFTIINTRSRKNPEEAFKRTRWEESKFHD